MPSGVNYVGIMLDDSSSRICHGYMQFLETHIHDGFFGHEHRNAWIGRGAYRIGGCGGARPSRRLEHTDAREGAGIKRNGPDGVIPRHDMAFRLRIPIDRRVTPQPSVERKRALLHLRVKEADGRCSALRLIHGVYPLLPCSQILLHSQTTFSMPGGFDGMPPGPTLSDRAGAPQGPPKLTLFRCNVRVQCYIVL